MTAPCLCSSSQMRPRGTSPPLRMGRQNTDPSCCTPIEADSFLVSLAVIVQRKALSPHPFRERTFYRLQRFIAYRTKERL
jgi:hypothetical protein